MRSLMTLMFSMYCEFRRWMGSLKPTGPLLGGKATAERSLNELTRKALKKATSWWLFWYRLSSRYFSAATGRPSLTGSTRSFISQMSLGE